ncbi:putative disease resistance protein RGA1 [Triticum aestivum]|uniref:putative disease resistance protein RGA1 n=1 Tax=Triticum aestivum TaxID=4565 RepID=UPI001D0209D5|nr:putative disease resistance protein RGA1 [Triticum aestivum]
MAESLLLPLVRSVAGKAANTLVEAVTRMCGLDNDRRGLERQLLAVEYKLARAEERSKTNTYIKSWRKELKSVAYEAGDVLDDFQYEALRRQSKIGKSTTCKVLSYITHHNPLLFHFEMSKKLKTVLKKINKLVEEMKKFGLEDPIHREERQHLWRQTHSKLDESTEISGRENDKKMVVKLLLDQQDQQKVHVLPIFGMRGLGKTTLAKMLKMWHCVSENFDAIAILKSIIELAVNKRCDMPDTIKLLRKQLEEVIGRKRFLLVLDDVWNENKRMWEDEMKPLLCSISGPGSVIVVTCRSKQVASIMCTAKPHELAFLHEKDSWELFSKKAFSNGVQEQVEFVTIGRRIVNKCGGLPLALKTMGGLLSSKQQVHKWKAIEECSIADIDRGKYEVMPILKLSYKHLSSEMKQCFAFCAVFPKDHEMEKEMLIQLWMVNGFIQTATLDLKQKGELILDELVWRSFLQDKQKSTNFHIKGFSYVCHMHISKAELKQINWLCKGRTYLRTLLAPSNSHKDFKELLRTMAPNFGVLNNLQILTTFVVDTGEGLGIEQLKDLQHLSNRLELLNLNKIKSGENAKVANLTQKQNVSELLFLWDQEIDDGPKDMACNVEEVLQCLEPHSNIQKLEISGYGGLEISQWMRKPQMFDCLRELKISNYPRCKSIPVVWLSESLEVLFLQKLDNLTTLCTNLSVEAGGRITTPQIFPRLKKLLLLELPKLEMWAENCVGEPADNLVMFPMLQELTIRNCPTLASIPVIPVVSELQIVGVHNTSSSEEETLPLCLEELTILGCHGVVALPSNIAKLAKLRSLSVFHCTRLKALPDGMCGLTSLRQLKVWDCPGMEEFPHGLLERLPSLEDLTRYDCPELLRRCREGREYFQLVSSVPP